MQVSDLAYLLQNNCDKKAHKAIEDICETNSSDT